MFPPVKIFVAGEPKGQPRARAFARNGMVRMYDPATAEGWKAAIADEWRRSAGAHVTATRPVSLTLVFWMPRPKSHFKSRSAAARAANAPAMLKANAPLWYEKKPDADNLAKAVMDALTQLKAWEDDDQVVILRVAKQYMNGIGHAAGCSILLKDADAV